MGAHEQVWVKINAPVDEGVADLIRVLSSFPKLETFASCQGGWARSVADKEGAPAAVFFHYDQQDCASSHREIADFVLGYVGPELMKELGDLASISLEVATQHIIMCKLTVRPGAMRRTVNVVRQLRRNFKG